jgi:hypothetical protein
VSSVLALFFWGAVLLELKHFICDFVLQTAYQYRNKGIYGHPGGLLHAGLHMTASLPAIVVLNTTAGLAAAILMAEFFVHYHVDWSKEQINKRCGLNSSDNAYWSVFGADQLLHQLTYVVILAVLARASSL